MVPNYSDRECFDQVQQNPANNTSGMHEIASGIRSSVDDAIDLTEDALPVFSEPETDVDSDHPLLECDDFDDKTEVSDRPPQFDTIVPAGDAFEEEITTDRISRHDIDKFLNETESAVDATPTLIPTGFDLLRPDLEDDGLDE